MDGGRCISCILSSYAEGHDHWIMVGIRGDEGGRKLRRSASAIGSCEHGEEKVGFVHERSKGVTSPPSERQGKARSILRGWRRTERVRSRERGGTVDVC